MEPFFHPLDQVIADAGRGFFKARRVHPGNHGWVAVGNELFAVVVVARWEREDLVAQVHQGLGRGTKGDFALLLGVAVKHWPDPDRVASGHDLLGHLVV